MARLVQFSAHVDSLQHLSNKVDKNVQTPASDYKKVLSQYEQWFKMSCKEILQLKQDIKELEKVS